MNRISKELESAIVSSLRSSIGIRKTARSSGVNYNTVRRVATSNGIEIIRNKGNRDRREYLVGYNATQTTPHHQMLKIRDKIHGCIALWLAKNRKPQPLDKIHTAISIQFPSLKKTSLHRMLIVNVWQCYRRGPAGWTFVPPPFYFPFAAYTAGKPSKYPEMESARAIYYEVRGIRDVQTEQAIAALIKKNEEFIEKTKQQAVRSAIPHLRLMATAAAIGRTR